MAESYLATLHETAIYAKDDSSYLSASRFVHNFSMRPVWFVRCSARDFTCSHTHYSHTHRGHGSNADR